MKPERSTRHRLRLISRLLQPHRPMILLSLLLILISRIGGLVLPGSMAYLIDHVMGRHDLAALPRLIALVLLGTIVQGAAEAVMGISLGRAAQRITTDMRVEVQAHLGRLPMAFFDQARKGSLGARIMKDGGGLRDLLGPATVQSLGSLATGALGIAGMFAISPRITFPLVTLLAALAFTLRRFSTRLRPRYHIIAQLHAELTGRLTESLGGVRVVKAYAAEASEASLFAAGAHSLAEQETMAASAQARYSLGSTFGLLVVTLAALLAGTQQVLTGSLSVGRLVTFLAFAGYSAAAARQLGSLRMQLAAMMAALDRTEEILAQGREEDDPARTVTLPPIAGALRFDHVSFHYHPGKPVLHDITFSAAPGTLTALVGASGSGKSTISNLACGFYTASTGVVSVDGVDLATLRLSSYRTQLGLVFQEPFLFSGSIRDNILFARPQAPEAKVAEACRQAHVDQFVQPLQDGYETFVGERGVRLSGGQQQRLCMARAILAEGRIVILDEATSSLDSETEQIVRENLKELAAGRTMIVIAHRLSTIQRADQILVLDGGRIVERGTHHHLLERRGRYFELYHRQYG